MAHSNQESRSETKASAAIEKSRIVAIGGSAGCLEALEQFLLAIPRQSDLSLVVAIHFPAKNISDIADWLARYSAMPVMVVDKGQPLKANTIHVARLDTEHEGEHSIDSVFQWLAAEYGDQVVAIVLSGGGLDSAQGAVSIASRGGAVLVQDPDSAPHPEMPANTLRICDVAQPVPMELLASRMLKIAKVGREEPPDSKLTQQLQQVFHIVKRRTGNDFSPYKINTVMRRIDRRLKSNGLSDLEDYLRLLQESPDEAHALSQDFCIGVTVFFRDPEAFETISHQVIPALFASRSPDAPVRIWDACCATGEETYSLAILLQEYQRLQHISLPVKIFATDLDEGAIAKARTGIFPESAMIDIGGDRVENWFRRVEEGYQVKKSLREMIIFAHHNLLKDPAFSRLDMIVCRNFFIYLNTDIQKRLLVLFHSMLCPGGYLFMGNSESIGTLTDLFSPIDKRWRIFKKRETGRVVMEGFPVSKQMQTTARPTQSVFHSEPSHKDPGKLAEELLIKRFAPPCVVVNEKYEVVHVTTPASQLLEVPIGSPTTDLFKMVREELRPALRAAIHKAVTKGERVIFRGQSMNLNNQPVEIDVSAEPLVSGPGADKLALVTLQPIAVEPRSVISLPGADQTIPYEASRKDELIRNLEEQLHLSQEELNATIEQLATSNDSLVSTNEELMSVNEEFQSTNEELETSKEELQTLNEELITLNTELQKKVEALDVVNNDIENLLNSTQIATLFLDRNLKVKRYTPAALTIFNLISSDVSRPLAHITGKIAHGDIAGDATRVIESGKALERPVISKDGERFFLMRILPYQTQSGDTQGVVLTFVDLTDQRKMEESLREQARILDLAPVIVRDLNDRILFWNTGATRLYGFTREETVGHLSHEILQTVFPESLANILRTLHAEDNWEGELLHYGKDGREIAVMSQWVLYHDQQNNPSRILEINTDITSRKLVERQYQLLFTSMTNGFALFDIVSGSGGQPHSFQLVAANPTFEKMTGIKESEVHGRELYQLIPGIEFSGGIFCQETATTGTPNQFLHIDSQGEKHFEFSLFRPAPKQLALLAVDFTDKNRAELERAQLERQLRQLQKMESLGVLAGGIAHDFNNILGVILGYAEFIKNDFAPNSQHGKGIANILASAQRAKELVKQILTFSRQADVDLVPLNLEPQIIEALHLIRATLPQTIAIKQQLAPHCAATLANPTQVHQIIMNLCTNAFHAMEETGGTLVVSLDMVNFSASGRIKSLTLAPGDYLALKVSDTGIGINQAIRDRIFDPYFTTKAIGKGSGMGLSIAHGIVKSYGGDITVDSTVGKGSTFTVFFPAIKDIGEHELQSGGELFGGNEKILYVEDELMMVGLYKLVLGKLGYQVVACHNSVEALTLFSRNPNHFDLVITDQTMPGLTGIELSRRLLKLRPDLPIILYTGFSNIVNEQSAKRFGIRELLYKPVSMHTLTSTIRKVLDTPQ